MTVCKEMILLTAGVVGGRYVLIGLGLGVVLAGGGNVNSTCGLLYT